MKTADSIPFYRPKNFYEEDPYFSSRIRNYLPEEDFAWAGELFQQMGELSAQKISPLVLTSDQNPPQLIPYDPQGNRVDQLEYHSSYRQIAKWTYEFGIIGLGHSPEFKDRGRSFSPLIKFGLGYLFSQSGSVLYCPICMTDGTLQLLERHGSTELKKKWIPRITSMDMKDFADGGMYLTEAQGGSDVGANTTEARQENGTWRLYGKKWFCSNAGSATAMVLARPTGAKGGTPGLGLFLVPWNLEDGTRNALVIDRVKPKLGTCEMATAEISLEGALAYPVGELDQGFNYMTEMLNLSRVYNAVWSIGLMQRSYLEARYYAANRIAFGKPIQGYPLVAQTLDQLQQASHRALNLVLETLSYMDRLERGTGDESDEKLLRLLTPVIKFYTAEKAIESAHQAIEIFGGNGCIEDFPVAKMLRDSQILAIWEGTANILSLDLLRVMKKEGAHELFLKKYEKKIGETLPAGPREAARAQLKGLEGAFQNVFEGRDG
ncbi:MAG: acyl-CoA dehydrogenase family protein, partial [bacterium]|nr:acyl-CoA dehydrogenase family protein [bacterium]